MNAKEILAMREQRKALKTKIDEIVDLAENESRDFNDAENANLTTLKDDLGALDLKIDESLGKLDTQRQEDELRAKKEAEVRREERMRKLEQEQDIRDRRVLRASNPGSGSVSDTEIRVADNLPFLGKSPTSFIAAYGGEQRGKTEAYKSGMWALDHIFGNEEARRWNRDYSNRALNGSVNSQGAVLAPDSLMNAVIWNVEDRGIFAQNANVVQMGQNDTIFVPKSTGEVTVYAVSENQTAEVTDSDPSFDGVELTARTWGLLTKVSRNLSDDAVINIGEYLSRKFGWAIADKTDRAGFNGDATSTHNGITGLMTKINDGNHAGSIYTALAGNNTFATMDMEDFEGVVGKLPQFAESDADVAWYISKPGFYASMARLMDAAGGNTQDNVAGGKGLQFLGYPVRISQVLFSTLTTSAATVHCLFGSLKRTAIYAQKKELSIQVLVEKYATYNQIGLLGFTRFGINCHELGDGTNAGSMIALKAP